MYSRDILTAWYTVIGEQEYGGNLNEAVNAYFIEGDRYMYGISCLYFSSVKLFHLFILINPKFLFIYLEFGITFNLNYLLVWLFINHHFPSAFLLVQIHQLVFLLHIMLWIWTIKFDLGQADFYNFYLLLELSGHHCYLIPITGEI